jgi:hypothetical protein
MGEVVSVVLDTRILNDAALMVALASCGLTKEAVDAVCNPPEGSEQRIMEKLLEHGVTSRQGALRFAGAAKYMIREFLEMSGCPDHAVSINVDFIVDAMQESVTATPLGGTRDASRIEG